jgi:glycosyltransferase involved in cell wall biosynthesis
MTQQPLVSILINNHNYGHFLAKAIDSALAQTYSNIEVIVVDDGSTDDSRSRLAAYGDRIQTILKPNAGQSSCFNAGFAASRGEIICLLDADDWFEPEKVEQVVQKLVQHPEAGWCFHLLHLWDDQQSAPCETQQSHTGSSGFYDITGFVRRGKVGGTLPFSGTATSGLCFHRSLLQKILPMPQVLDVSLSDEYIKYAAYGLAPGYVILEQLAVQRIHSSNTFTLRTDKSQLKAKMFLMTAYWLRQNFPPLLQFSNNLFAAGIAVCQGFKPAREMDETLVRQYFQQASWQARLMIHLRVLYYCYRPSYGNRN